MAHEKSCGAVLYYTKQGRRIFLLVNSHYYGFPKGHVEEGETEKETALREIKEETGISAEILDGFRETVNYHLANGNSKEVVFFVARYENQRYTVNHDELVGITLATYERALHLLNHPDTKNVLKDANKWLNEHGYE